MKSLLAALCISYLLSSVFGSHSGNVGSRYQYPDTDPSYRQNKPSNYKWPFDTNQGNVNSPMSSQCGVSNTYKASIPQGKAEVSYIERSDVERPDDCVRACCDKGHDKCQYAWIFANKCFLVGCNKEESELCEPLKFEGSSVKHESIYYKVQHTTELGDNTVSPPTTIPPTTKAPIVTEPSPDNPLEPNTIVPETIQLTTKTALEMTTKNNNIIVATNGDTDITLPTNKAKLYGDTWPKPDSHGSYLYKWEKVAGPEQGNIVGKDDKDVELRDLVPGMYTLRLKVTNWLSSDWGERFINITVHPANHVNSPPVPVILPNSNSEITLPQDSIVLDAQSTTDDLGSDGLKFHWEEVAGPLTSNLESDSPLLRLTGLTEGLHQFKLTVTDLDGAVATATANVKVAREQNYPPVAHAGNPVVLHLPNNEATLDGSRSKDEDKLKYKWTYLSGPGGGDMEGANTVRLHVKNLILGNHQYQLEVTDSSGQTNTDTVSVIVTAEDNLPPIANGGGNKTVVFPATTVILNGEHSTDDYLISSFKWTQRSGPVDVTLSNTDSNSLTVSRLHIDKNIGSPTMYSFMLTVTDYRNLTDTDIVCIFYQKDPNLPPVASAGVDINITLPQSAVILDGTGSYDDFGISSYRWIRSMDSPAAGHVVDGSDKKDSLILSNLVNGTYHFTLTVTNTNGESAEDSVTVTILPNPSDRFLLQVHLEGDITQFTKVDVNHFKHALAYLLFDGAEEHDIQVVDIIPEVNHIMVEFFAVGKKSKNILNTTEAYYKLTERGQDYRYTSYHILQVEMKVCQLPCSGHGRCNPKTKKCECSTFWTENPFKSKLGRKESNCEWSVFYVALVVLGIVAVLLICLWLCCCCCVRRRRRSRSKRRIRYAILDNKGGDSEAMQMLPKDYKQTSLMVSESETEEEILFESPRKMLNNDTRKGNKIQHTQVKNGKILTTEVRRGNQSSKNANENTE